MLINALLLIFNMFETGIDKYIVRTGLTHTSMQRLAQKAIV